MTFRIITALPLISLFGAGVAYHWLFFFLFLVVASAYILIAMREWKLEEIEYFLDERGL